MGAKARRSVEIEIHIEGVTTLIHVRGVEVITRVPEAHVEQGGDEVPAVGRIRGVVHRVDAALSDGPERQGDAANRSEEETKIFHCLKNWVGEKF